jgi:hypothetical protein
VHGDAAHVAAEGHAAAGGAGGRGRKIPQEVARRERMGRCSCL